MSFALQPRLEALRAARLNRTRRGRERAPLQPQQQDATAAFAQQQGRAALEGLNLQKPPQLLDLEAAVARLAEALPNARAARLEELRLFKQDAIIDPRIANAAYHGRLARGIGWARVNKFINPCGERISIIYCRAMSGLI